MSRRRRYGGRGGAKPEQPAAGGQTGGGGQPVAAGAPSTVLKESVIALPLGGRNPITACNAYLIPGSKHVLVDPGPPGSAGELLEKLSLHGISLGDIGLIVITHGHPDHFGCAAQLKEWTRAPLAVQELDAEYLNWGSVPAPKPATRLGSMFKSFFKIKCRPVEPDIILRDGDNLGRYAGRGRVLLTPGHTAGSISILLPDGNCIIGDVLMRGFRARTPSSPWFAEDSSLVKESLQKVVDAGARTLLPGHGGPFQVKDLPRSFPWLELRESPGTPEGRDERERRFRPRRPRPQEREPQPETRPEADSPPETVE